MYTSVYLLVIVHANTECVLGEDRFYIVSPIDILLAQKRDVADHIDWLLQRKNFEVHACYCYMYTIIFHR